jgi:outer membrane protein
MNAIWPKREGFFVLEVNKKQVKMVSLGIAALFIIGIVGIALAQGGTGAVTGTAQSNIGVVNHDMVVSQDPDMTKVQQEMQAAITAAKKDFDTKTASMNAKDKQAYYLQVQQQLTTKQQELMAPVLSKVDETIKQVAAARGLTVVLDKANVIYGGQDITNDVLKKISGK